MINAPKIFLKEVTFRHKADASKRIMKAPKVGSYQGTMEIIHWLRIRK